MGATETRVYFNARCSKCRQARDLLSERGVRFELIDYLDNPPSRTELEEILELLGAIAEHPALLQRPIVVRSGRAVVARPPEKLLDLL